MTPMMKTRSIALSAEMGDIDVGLSPEFENVRGHPKTLQKPDMPGTVEVMGFKTYYDDDLDRIEANFKNKRQLTAWRPEKPISKPAQSSRLNE